MKNKNFLNQIFFAFLTLLLGIMSITVKGAEGFSFLATVSAIVSACYAGIGIKHLLPILFGSIAALVITGLSGHIGQVAISGISFWGITLLAGIILSIWKKVIA